MDTIFDLFGNPVRPGHGGRGRPPFEVTERNRNKVKLLLAMGWSTERVANALDCSPATIRRYFRSELRARDRMRDQLEAERLMSVTELAMSGNVGAHRQLDRLVDRNDQMLLQRRVQNPEVETEADAAPVKAKGKKEGQVEAAKRVVESDPLLQPGLLN